LDIVFRQLDNMKGQSATSRYAFGWRKVQAEALDDPDDPELVTLLLLDVTNEIKQR
jgi:hypothetical protein